MIIFNSEKDLFKNEYDFGKIITPKWIWITLDQTGSRKVSNSDRIWWEILKIIIVNLLLLMNTILLKINCN